MKEINPSPKRGQTLVEFALLLPVLLLLALVVIDLGRAIYFYSAIHNAAREGARYGIINPDSYSGMTNTAINYAFGLGLDNVDVIAGPGPDEIIGNFPNPTVRVRISYSFTPATPLVSRLLPGGTINLTSQAVMRTEKMPSSSP